MSGSGLSEINATLNSSLDPGFNATERSFPVYLRQYNQVGVVIPTVVQFILCSLALVAIVRIRSLRTGQNLFLTNVVIADLIGTLVGIWVVVLGLSDIDTESKAARYADACKAFHFIWHLQFFGLMWGTVLIAYSRYSMAARPFQLSITTRKAAIAIACTWTVGAVVASLPLYTWARCTLRYNSKQSIYKCGADPFNPGTYLSFYLFFYAISYATPVILVATFLVMILQKIVKSAQATQRLGKSTRTTSNVESGKSHSLLIDNSKAFWYVVIVVSTNAILPAPYIVGLLLYNRALYTAGGIIIRINFVINSVFCVFSVKTFHRSLWDIIQCRKICSTS